MAFRRHFAFSFLDFSLLNNDYKSVRVHLLRIYLRFSWWSLFFCRSWKRGPRVPKLMVCFRKNLEHKTRWHSRPNPEVSATYATFLGPIRRQKASAPFSVFNIGTMVHLLNFYSWRLIVYITVIWIDIIVFYIKVYQIYH